ncbi:Pimeloyl-ACP methyl ester carboxylesterase [Burkholderia sp. D7]|nr:Pimeloyl-ACP methyl ester carboxylesterase [Burkholderia sp. D7]
MIKGLNAIAPAVKFHSKRHRTTTLAVSSAAVADTKSYTVTAPDGVTLAIQESGNPHGPAVVLIHGLLGSRLNWDAQVNSAELRRYRIITYDLRGHGLSGKPTDAQAYRDGRRWADDLATIIESSHASHAVLVGWSLGGAVISNYLAAYGDSQIAGAVYVDGVIELKEDQIVSHPEVYRDMISSDLKTHLDGERIFLGLCFHTQPDKSTTERLLANAAMASWDMQSAVQSMAVAASEGLSKTRVPVLLLYGEHDALVNTSGAIARAKELDPHIQTKLYANSGHAPFIEEPDRFNHDLAAFIDTAVAH